MYNLHLVLFKYYIGGKIQNIAKEMYENKSRKERRHKS